MTMLAASSTDPAPVGAGFTLDELRRVGVAATMIVIGGTAIILLIMLAMGGYYSSLSHALPKAVLDGLVIALLIGRRGRWRCLALLGTVYGLVLLLQIGVAYLLPVMVVAGVGGAVVGRMMALAHRTTAVVAAAVTYELLAGFGAPVMIYFGTGGEREPFVWGLWFAEWPLRIVGAAAGVWLARIAGSTVPRPPHDAARTQNQSTVTKQGDADAAGAVLQHGARDRRLVVRGRRAAGLRLAASVTACVAPMMLESWLGLGVVAAAALGYALWAGLRWRIVHVLAGLVWGWVVFGVLSYLWHHDTSRAVDMLRTLVLRFLPLTLASLVLVSTVRPVDVIRVLRTLRVSGAVLIPLAGVVRSIPHSRREMRRALEQLRQQGVWTGPWSLVRRPVTVLGRLLGPQFQRWRNELAETDGAPHAP